MNNVIHALHKQERQCEKTQTHFEFFSYPKNLFFNLIQKNPGIRFNEIMRLTGLKNGVVSYHLLSLERQGKICSVRTPRVTRFYTLEISEDSQKIIMRLRQKTPYKIITSLLDESLSFKELVQKVGKSPSNTSHYLTKLIEDQIVIDVLKNRKRLYQISKEIHSKIFHIISEINVMCPK